MDSNKGKKYKTKPTLKQKRFVKYYLETGNKTEATRRAYNVKEQNATVLSQAVIKAPAVQNLIRVALQKEGLEDDYVAQSLHKLTEAGLREESLVKAKPDDALRALKEINKLRDSYPVERKRIEQAVIKMDLKDKTTDELVDMLEQTRNELLTFQRMVSGTRKADSFVNEEV